MQPPCKWSICARCTSHIGLTFGRVDTRDRHSFAKETQCTKIGTPKLHPWVHTRTDIGDFFSRLREELIFPSLLRSDSQVIFKLLVNPARPGSGTFHILAPAPSPSVHLFSDTRAGTSALLGRSAGVHYHAVCRRRRHRSHRRRLCRPGRRLRRHRHRHPRLRRIAARYSNRLRSAPRPSIRSPPPRSRPSIGIASAAIAVTASVTTALAAACVVTHASTAAIAAIASALRFSQAGHPVQRPLSTGHLRRS